MKNKTIISILAIFIIVGCLAAVYAEEAHVGSFDFNVPSGFKITESDTNNVVLEGNNKEITVTIDKVDQGSITKYLQSKGFKYDSTLSGNSTVYNYGGSAPTENSYSYVAISFSKGSETAIAYMLNKDGVNFAVILIDHSGGDTFGIDNDASLIINDIMFG